MNTATSIMFEEIKVQLQNIEKKLNKIQHTDLTSDNSLLEIKEIIQNIEMPSADIKRVEEMVSDIKAELFISTQRIEELVQQKEEDKVVSHIHSIHIKSVKVCIVFSVLYILLMISVYFNFR